MDFLFLGAGKTKITSRARNNAFPSFLLTQMGHFVVSAAQLEAEYRQQILSLQKDVAF